MHREYMTSLHRLVRESQREIDRGQMHEPPSQDWLDAVDAAMDERGKVIVKMEEERRGDPAPTV